MTACDVMLTRASDSRRAPVSHSFCGSAAVFFFMDSVTSNANACVVEGSCGSFILFFVTFYFPIFFESRFLLLAVCRFELVAILLFSFFELGLQKGKGEKGE